jgi:hypothetical protein
MKGSLMEMLKSKLIYVVLVLLSMNLHAQDIPETMAGHREGNGGDPRELEQYIQQKRAEEAVKVHLAKYQKEFCEAARSGFENLKIIRELNMDVPITSDQEQIANEYLIEICAPQSAKFKLNSDLKDVQGNLQAAENYVDASISINPIRWEELRVFKRSEFLFQSIAVHEILSLPKLKLESTNFYPVSFLIYSNGERLHVELHNRIALQSHEYDQELQKLVEGWESPISDQQLDKTATHSYPERLSYRMCPVVRPETKIYVSLPRFGLIKVSYVKDTEIDTAKIPLCDQYPARIRIRELDWDKTDRFIGMALAKATINKLEDDPSAVIYTRWSDKGVAAYSFSKSYGSSSRYYCLVE